MKSVKIFFLFIIFLSPLFQVEAASVIRNRFIDKEKGFSIAFPKSWTTKEELKGAAVIAFSPRERKEDPFFENVNVVVSSASLQGYDAQKYFQTNLGPLSELENFKEIERGETFIEGKKAIWIIFTHQTGEVDAKAIQYYLVRDSRGYVITGTGLSNTFSKYRPQFNQIAKSFKGL